MVGTWLPKHGNFSFGSGKLSSAIPVSLFLPSETVVIWTVGRFSRIFLKLLFSLSFDIFDVLSDFSQNSL